TGPYRAEDLTRELERLSDAIHSMARGSSDQDAGLLRKEVDLVRDSLDRLAREDTMRAVEQRWDDFDRRFDAFEERFAGSERAAADPAVAVLAARLEEINEA